MDAAEMRGTGGEDAASAGAASADAAGLPPAADAGPGGAATAVAARPRRREGALDRWLTIAAMVLAGLVVGALTTLLHRARLGVGGTPIWLGIVVALAALALLAVGLRLYLRERGSSLGFAIGVTLAVVLLASWSAGRNSVIVVGDLLGMAWMVAAPAVVWLAAVWPSVRVPAEEDAPGGAAPSPTAEAASKMPADTAREYPGHPATDPEEPQP